MRTNGDEPLTRAVETYRSNGIMEMHLFDEDAREEKALCGADASADCLRSVGGYLEDRLEEIGVGTVCEACKALAIPFAQAIALDLEDADEPDEAQKYRKLAETLARETGRDWSGN